MCLFGPYNFAPIEAVPVGFGPMYFLIYGLITHKNRGGNFTGDQWRATVDEVSEYDPTAQFKLFVPIDDNRFHENPNFLCVLNEDVNEELYRSIVSTIAEKTYSLDPFIVRNLTKLLHNNLSAEQVAAIENPNGEAQYMEFIRWILESLKNCYKSNIICFDCCISIENHEQAVKHASKFHKNFLSPAEVLRQQAERANRLVREERDRWTEHHEVCNPDCNFR